MPRKFRITMVPGFHRCMKRWRQLTKARIRHAVPAPVWKGIASLLKRLHVAVYLLTLPVMCMLPSVFQVNKLVAALCAENLETKSEISISLQQRRCSTQQRALPASIQHVLSALCKKCKNERDNTTLSLAHSRTSWKHLRYVSRCC